MDSIAFQPPEGLPAVRMHAIRKNNAGPGFEYVGVPKPVPGPREVLIKVSLASVCGTDFHITEWDAWSAARIHPPMTYGHEFCGVIESVGSQETILKPGDYVSAEMHLPCGRCPQCLQGRKHTCEQVQIFGIDRDGCFADYIALPAKQVIRLPETLKPEHGALLDSLGNAVHAVSKAEVAGRRVCVVGCGPLGLFAIQVARAMGALAVYATDVHPYRLDLARRAGADAVLNASDGPASAEIMRLTQHHGVDVVLEMSGNTHAIADAFTALKLGGTVVMMGIPKGPIAINLVEDVIFKEARIIGVNGRLIFETWFLMLDLLQAGKLDLDFIITHRLKLADFAQAIDLIRSGASGKILLAP